ncbi:MAG: retroviral-like aspartic protease family protein [Dehalococcoidales bacterium]|nr:retroviral-like aspartic protease family protein [Dehalococcoidales bacterium]
MCRLVITEIGTLLAPAIIRIPTLNFVAPSLRNDNLTDADTYENNIVFMVDTGAQITCISGLDAMKLGIETFYLEASDDIVGVGGSSKAYKLKNVEIGLIENISRDKISFHIEKIDQICVIDSLKMMSLLGTDLLKRFDLVTKRSKDEAYLKRCVDAEGKFRIISKKLPPKILKRTYPSPP